MAGVPATFFTDKADIQLEFSLQWSFPDYQTWLEKGDDNFKGIPINNQSAGCWQLEIPIKETREGDKLGRHIKLTMLMKDDSNGYLARMSILNPAQEPRLQREILGFSCNSTLGIFFFSSRALKALVNVTGGLTIKVEIAKLKTKTNPKPGAIQIPKSELSKEIVTWFKCEEFGDVTIVSGDGQKFRFYKGILSARSDVFRAMFSHDMVESQTNNVTIERFSSDVIGSLLLYIYNDEVGDIGGYVHSLYEAAHQYQLEPLKSICEAVLIRQLSSESIAASLCLAIRLEVKKLAENCVEFLNRYNHRLPVARLLHEASVLSQRIQHDSRQADSESL